MITGIKINNIRNLDFDDYLRLKPLTVLLGKNSSGKSTFLRTFPLLKQTLELKRSTPLLWYGNLVDFGSFDETFNKYSKQDSKQIKISFEITPTFFERIFKKEELKLDKIYFDIWIEKGTNDFLSRIEILIEKWNYILILDENKKIQTIKVNETEINNLDLSYNFSIRELIPTNFYRGFLSERIIRKIFENISIQNEDKEKIKNKFLESNIFEIFQIKVRENILYRNLNIVYFINKLYLMKDEEIIDRLKNFTSDKIEVNKEKIKILKNLLLIFEFERILDYVNMEIFCYFDNIFYTAPLRATAQRYYRIQGLDVEEVDSSGSNLTTYLKNLNETEQGDFSIWVEENFGFKPILVSSGGHTSLAIQKKEKIFNLADTGFGFSQILPIILQVWSKIFRKNRSLLTSFLNGNSNLTFLIEQPELHLHPAMQASLIDIFIKLIKLGKKKEYNIKFVIETHSETIINRIGRHIVEENFESKDEEIIIFENDENSKLELVKTNISEEGIIERWPFGFFEPEELKK